MVCSATPTQYVMSFPQPMMQKRLGTMETARKPETNSQATVDLNGVLSGAENPKKVDFIVSQCENEKDNKIINLCELKKGFSEQNVVLELVEHWKSAGLLPNSDEICADENLMSAAQHLANRFDEFEAVRTIRETTHTTPPKPRVEFEQSGKHWIDYLEDEFSDELDAGCLRVDQLKSRALRERIVSERARRGAPARILDALQTKKDSLGKIRHAISVLSGFSDSKSNHFARFCRSLYTPTSK